MEIGIITLPFASNYGGILQNWALQQVLIRMGHSPVTVDCASRPGMSFRWNLLKTDVKTLMYRFVGVGNLRWTMREKRRFLAEVAGPLNDFVRREIVSERVPYRSMAKMSGRLDAWIVGSDQVWRPVYNPDLDVTFLKFARNIPVRKVAYAASFGVDEWEYSDSQTSRYRSLAGLFDSVSVRERSGVALCEKYLGVEASVVLDPTMLLSQEDYSELCGSTPRRGDRLVAFFLDPTDEKIELAGRMASEQGLTLDLVQPFGLAGMNRHEAGGFRMRGVEEWLRSMMEAGAVLTDSYHGTVFSILFEKDFWVLVNPGRGTSRFDSLLDTLGLTDRTVNPSAPDLAKTETPDWTSVRNRLDSLRGDSLAFLEKALGKQ